MISKVKNLFYHFNFANVLAFYVVTLIFVFFFYLCSSRFPIALLKDVGDIKIALITVLTGIVAYYFGSSKSSKDKQETIADLVKDK